MSGDQGPSSAEPARLTVDPRSTAACERCGFVGHLDTKGYFILNEDRTVHTHAP